jgi:hypothetical protein
MTSYEQLTEQHIREHQLRQQKRDERDAYCLANPPTLLGAAGEGDDGAWRQETVNQAGPMGVIDAVAQDLEAFVELFERAPRCDLPPPTRRRSVHIS